MTLIDLNSIHFYQAPPKARLADQNPSMALVSEVLDPIYNQVSELQGTEIYGGGNFAVLAFWWAINNKFSNLRWTPSWRRQR